MTRLVFPTLGSMHIRIIDGRERMVDLFFVDGIDAGRLNPRISWETCLSWRERKVGNDSTCRDLQWQGQRIREFYSWKKRSFCAISFAVASYAIKPALTNSGPTTLGFPRFDPRKYTKLHLNALFSVQFTRLVPNFIVIFFPMENRSPLSILPIFFFRKKKGLNDCSFSRLVHC